MTYVICILFLIFLLEYDRAESLDDEIRDKKDELTKLTTTLTSHGVDINNAITATTTITSRAEEQAYKPAADGEGEESNEKVDADDAADASADVQDETGM